MSTVPEILAAIGQLSPEDRDLLLEELHLAQIGSPDDDPAVLAAIDEGIADDDADRVHSIEEVREMVTQWVSELRSQSAR